WVRLEQVLPATYPENWQPTADAIGLQGPRESLLYVMAPWVSFSGSSTNTLLPLQQGQSVTLTNWPPGRFFADWYDPATGTNAGSTQASATNGSLILALPNFSEDLAGIVYPPPTLAALGTNIAGSFQMRLNSETGGRYVIEQSTNLADWSALFTVTNDSGSRVLVVPGGGAGPRVFYRARQSP
ncbi:MAG TPA: hypothetical protein VKU37_11575, partial [Verrucomicrobiae bacterium]|nr:hypothetical protein [Verrucomicrobiae bacterium]